jgi:hypothetical protein
MNDFELNNNGSIPSRDRFSLPHHVESGFSAHLSSYPLETVGFVPKVNHLETEGDYTSLSHVESCL